MAGDRIADGGMPAVLPCAKSCPRHASLKPILYGVGWLAAAVGALSVAAIPYEFGEARCGIWGCYPPLTALAAMHLFWAVIFAAAIWAVRGWRPALLRPAGVVLLLAALAGISAIHGKDLYDWLEWVPPEARHYWPRRVAYLLATLTDVPLLQCLMAGVAAIALGGRRGNSSAAIFDRDAIAETA